MSKMTLDQVINEYQKVVAMIAADLASGLLEGHAKEKREREYELFKAGRDALIEKQVRLKEQMKGYFYDD
jgi:hypothetical protein